MTAASCLEAALGYAARGWRAVPLWWPAGEGCGCPRGASCRSPGKHPIPRAWQEVATTDPDAIRRWWRARPAANVGLATGPASGVWVLDVDPPGGADALEALEAEHGPLPATLTARTGSGGEHRLWGWPQGRTFTTASGKSPGRRGLPEGLDVRGDRGQIVAAPSLHASGRRYAWTGDAPVADAPGWLLDLVDPPPVRAAPRPAPPRPPASLAPYVRAALERETRAVRTAGAGGRHLALNRAAFNLGGLVGGGELPEPVASEALTAAGLASGLPEAEVAATVGAGLRDGAGRPRGVPARTGRRGSHRASGAALARAPSPEAPRPPVEAVAALWDACAPAAADPGVAGWLRSRGLDPAKVEDRDLARALPEDLDVPRWANFKGRPWTAGWRCVLPAYDAQGRLASLRARWCRDGTPPTGDAQDKESAAAAGARSSTGLVYADALGAELLRTGARPGWWPEGEDLAVVVAEGAPDFLTWAVRWGDAAEDAPAVLGVWSGAWTPEVAARVPADARVTVRTHGDDAGDRYAEAVRSTLADRCTVLRAKGSKRDA